MTPTSVGLYLGSDSADLVILTGSFQHPRLVHFGRVALSNQAAWLAQVRAEEKGMIPEGEEAPAAPPGVEEEMIRALQTLLGKADLPSPKASAAVSSEAVVVRYFQMPAIPIRERPLAVSFEAKKYLPFKLGELVTDFQALIHRSDPTLMRIIFAGIKRSSLATILALFKSVELIPLCLEPVPISLMRLLKQKGRLSPGQVAAILYVEKETATISIARDNLLYLSRNLTILTPSESGLGPSGELMGALVNETRVSIDYYRRRFLGEQGVSKVILFGQNVAVERVEELKGTLDLPVERGDSFERISGGQEIPAGLAVATGLALRGLEKRVGGINLLPPEYRQDSQGLLKPIVTQIAALFLLLAFWFGFSAADLDKLEQRISALRHSQVSPAGVSPGMDLLELERIQREQESELQFLRDLSKDRGVYTSLLGETARLLPGQAWLRYAYLEDTFKADKPAPFSSMDRKRVLKLAGGFYAKDGNQELQQINLFLSSLRSNSLFKSAFSDFQLERVQRARFHGEEITEFNLSCASGAKGSKDAF